MLHLPLDPTPRAVFYRTALITVLQLVLISALTKLVFPALKIAPPGQIKVTQPLKMETYK